MFEKTLLSNLVFNEDFTRKTLPFIKPDFFKGRDEVALFNIISDFVIKYNNLPTKEALTIELSNLKNITEEEFKQSKQLLNEKRRRQVTMTTDTAYNLLKQDEEVRRMNSKWWKEFKQLDN